MHSSTSNSDTRKPKAPYLQIWVGIIALASLFLIASEFIWQTRGFLPNVVDTKIFWAEHRDNIYAHNNREKIVIVGTSRAQLGIDPVILASNFDNFDVVHLAIDGALPYDVIKNLCLDPNFKGTIIADVTIPFLCVTDSTQTQKERAYLTYYAHDFQSYAALEKRVNTYLGAILQSKFAIFSPALSFKALLYSRINPEWLYFHMHFNRFRPAHYYDRLTPQQLAKHKQARIDRITQAPPKRVSYSKFEALAKNELRTLYKTQKSKGGELFLIRMPTTGQHWQIDQEMAPKQTYWDQLEPLSGIPSIHFKDHTDLSKFECPDTSHLDARDVPPFTKALSKIIKKRVAEMSLPPHTM